MLKRADLKVNDGSINISKETVNDTEIVSIYISKDDGDSYINMSLDSSDLYEFIKVLECFQ